MSHTAASTTAAATSVRVESVSPPKANPSSMAPCGACGPRLEVDCGSKRRAWHFMQRLPSSDGSSIEKRSWPAFSLPCGSWQTAQVTPWAFACETTWFRST